MAPTGGYKCNLFSYFLFSAFFYIFRLRFAFCSNLSVTVYFKVIHFACVRFLDIYILKALGHGMSIISTFLSDCLVITLVQQTRDVTHLCQLARR